MARFDVHRNKAGVADVPYLLDIQSDLLQGLRSRVVVPLVPLRLDDAAASTTCPQPEQKPQAA
jgi:toxin CcdB